MKILSKKASAIFLILLSCSVASAQLKLYTTGALSIGSITQPPANTELQIIGNSLFSNNTGKILSSAYIQGSNIFSTDSTPDFSWWGDSKTGILHPVSNSIAFTINGTENMRLSPGNNLLIGSNIDKGDKVQITGNLNTNSFDIFSNATTNSIYSGINWVNDSATKTWAVKYNGQDKFYVLGSGQAYAYGWNTISDSTVKENIHQIKNALDKVLLLNGVTYNFKAAVSISGNIPQYKEFCSTRQMGLLAQSVERVAPEAVTTTGDGLKTVAYGNLVSLLVEAIKDEDKKVTRLQGQLDSSILSNKHIVNIPEETEINTYPINNALIHCYLPEQSRNAAILLFDMNGKLVKTLAVKEKGITDIVLPKKGLSAGMYYYSVVSNGKEIESRRLILTGKSN